MAAFLSILQATRGIALWIAAGIASAPAADLAHWELEAGPPGARYQYRVLGPADEEVATGSGVHEGTRCAIEAPATRPGVYRLRLETEGEPRRTLERGKVVRAGDLRAGLPRPDDFDAFWDDQLRRLAATPPAAQERPGDRSRPGVEHRHLRLALPDAAGMECQLAVPTGSGKHPAVVLFQYAGVYRLPPGIVTGRAAEGWLALNVNAHDLPLDRSEAFYAAQAEGQLRDYPRIGHGARETSYFLRMVLACRRAIEQVVAHPSWDGKTVVVLGTSQGGLQSIAAAALHPAVSAVIISVPAGCDTAALEAGRPLSWPYWLKGVDPEARAAVLRTSRYFDPTHFAPRVKCPVLLGVGLLDNTARPEGVLLMASQLGGPCEQVLMDDADHKGSHGTFGPFRARERAWLAALREGRAPEVDDAKAR